MSNPRNNENKKMKFLVLFYFYMVIIATNRFIVKYKLSQFIVPPSQEQLYELRKDILDPEGRIISEIQVEYLYTICNSAHIIKLSEDLNEEETRSFLLNVNKNDYIDYIEEDTVMSFFPLKFELNSTHSICLDWFDGCNRCKRGRCTEKYCYKDMEPNCIEWSNPCSKECQRIISGCEFVCTC